MTLTTHVAVIQHSAGVDVETNLSKLELLSRQAASAGAQVICWAEAFAYLGRHDGKVDILEPLPAGGPILDRCKALARELNCELLLGGFHEALPQAPTRCYNTSVFLTRSGDIAALYRKIHLFDVDIEDGPSLKESTHTAAGEVAVTTSTAFGKLGMSVCYDLRFPNLYQRLADMGAIAMSVPSAFTASTGQAHWHALLRARAIETQSYVIAPAQHGKHSKNRASFGHSIIIDPWGTVVAELPQGDGFVMAEIDPNRVNRVRHELPSLKNRRPIK